MHLPCSDHQTLFSRRVHSESNRPAASRTVSPHIRRLWSRVATAGLAGALVATTLIAAPSIADAAADASNPFLAPENLVADVKSPSNAKLNIYDYWLSTEDAQDAPANSHTPVGWRGLGINEGHDFHIGGQDASGGQSDVSINAWTGSTRPRTGIVKNKLVDGYPVLAEGKVCDVSVSPHKTTREQSLAYLFNGEEVKGKRVYADVKGLVQFVDGYYVYDSDKNFASLDPETHTFNLFKKSAVKRNGRAYPGMGGFFPLNKPEDVFKLDNNQTDGTTIKANEQVNSNNEKLNHYLGAELTVDFTQPQGGKIAGKDMTFHFAGDDDVWVFIDDVLVGDLGGIHGAAKLDINFATGAVTASDIRETPTWTESQPTIKERFEAALGAEEAAKYLQGDTLKPDTYHTMKFFYLERGNNDSNMRLSFNLKRVTQSSVQKDDQLGQAVSGAEFALYPAQKRPGGDYVKSSETPIWHGFTDASGSFKIMTPDGKRPYDFDEAYRSDKRKEFYILDELSAPAGYRPNPDAWLRYVPSADATHGGDGQDGFLVCDNTWDSGVYARPNQATYVNDQGIVKEPGGKKKYEVSTDNTLLAVVYKRDPDPDKKERWHPVGGSHGHWKVRNEHIVSIEDLNGMYFDYAHPFELNGESWMVDLGDLPGTPREYPFMAGSAQTANYSIGYYLVDMSREELEQKIGAGKKPITAQNTHLLDSTGKEHNFIRESYARLHVTDCENVLTVQKVDDAGNPVNGATFCLYRASDMEKDEDGTLKPKVDAVPYMERTTSNMSEAPSVWLDGAAQFAKIENPPQEGSDYETYYLVETGVPAGHVGTSTPVRVLVDGTGVYADAGKKDDNVTVSVGVGSLIDAMDHYGSNDGVEVTLHDIIAKKAVAYVADASKEPNSAWIQGWEPATGDMGEKDIHLVYNDKTSTHDYAASDAGSGKPRGGTRFSTDTGVIRANVIQDTNSNNHNHGIGSWENLYGKSLTHLFTGSTVVHVSNERIASLEVKKQVVIPDQLQGPADVDTKQFEFTLEFKGKDGTALDGPFDARVFDKNGAQVGKDLKISSDGTVKLCRDQVLRIYGLPDGATYKVTETPMPGFTQTRPVDDTGTAAPGEGTVVTGETQQVVFENTYTPAPATLDVAAMLKVKKNFLDAKGKPAWGIKFNQDPSFDFVLEADAGRPMPDGAVPDADGSVRSTVSIGRGNAESGYSASFGNITYDKPGTYYYALFESTPKPEERIPGVSYSQAAYRVTVTVEDDRAGSLKATLELRKLANDDADQINGDKGEVVEPENGVCTAEFTNEFKLNEVKAGPMGTKYLKDSDFSVNPDGSGRFQFRMQPVGATAATQPMPEGCEGKGENRYIDVSNKGTVFHFGHSTFTVQHLTSPSQTGSYDYELSEVIPDNAVNKDGKTWKNATASEKFDGGFKKDGVTYDSTRFVARINLSLVESPVRAAAPNQAIVAKIDYYKVLKFGDNGRWTGKPEDLKLIYDSSQGEPVVPPAGGDQEAPEGAGRVYFHNTYEATGSVAGIQLTKTLDGRDMKDDEFSFVVEGVDDASRELLDGAGGTNGSLSLKAPAAKEGKPAVMDMVPKLKFDQTHAGKTFAFDVREKTPVNDRDVKPIPGLENGWDQTVYRVEYRVEDNKDGTLNIDTSLTRRMDRDGNEVNESLDLNDHQADGGVVKLDFRNEYRASSSYSGIQVTKVMHGKNLGKNQFSFTITADPDDAKSASKLSADDKFFGSAAAQKDAKSIMRKLSGMTFTQDEACKHEEDCAEHTYTYYVREVVLPSYDTDKDPSNGVTDAYGVTYDCSTYVVRITPHDDGEGSIYTITTVERLTDAQGDALGEPEVCIYDSRDENGAVPEVPFENSYAPRGTSVDTDGRFSKCLTGRPWTPEDTFTFELRTLNPTDAPMPEGAVNGVATSKVTGADAKGETVKFGFGAISFDKDDLMDVAPDVNGVRERKFTYEVRERIPDDAVNAAGTPYGKASASEKAKGGFSKDGVTYSDRAVQFEIRLEDRGVGELFACVSKLTATPVDGADFVNVYDGAGSFGISARKKLTGRPLQAGEFAFDLTLEPNDPTAGLDAKPVQTSVNEADGTIPFDAVELSISELEKLVDEGYASLSVDGVKQTWELTYRVSERLDAMPQGVSPARPSFDVRVTVTDKGDGTLDAKVAYPADSGDGQMGVISNVYAAAGPVQVRPQGEKRLLHDEGLVPPDIAGKFTFTIEALDGGPLPKDGVTATNDAAGNVVFSPIEFTMDDVDRVLGQRPAVPSDDGAAAGDDEAPVEDKVSAEGDGVAAEDADVASEDAGAAVEDDDVSAEEDGAAAEHGGAAAERDGEAAEDAGVPAEDDVVSAEDDGTDVAPEPRVGLPREVTFRYRVSESGTVPGVTNDRDAKEFSYTVRDDGRGGLTVVSADSVPVQFIFANVYDADPVTVDLKASKVLEGRPLADGEFQFTLTEVDGDGKVLKASNAADASISFPQLTFERPGVYLYEMREVVPDDAVNVDGVRWADASPTQRDAGGFVHDGIEYDSAVRTVRVTVSDDHAGALHVEAVEWDGAAKFTNRVKPPVDPPAKPEPPTGPSAPDSPAVPDVPGIKPQDPGAGDKLPATGDSALPWALTLVGALLVGIAFRLRSRRRA